MFTELAIVVVLTLVNGFLAMSELAIVSSRTPRLKLLDDQGSRGAGLALVLAQDPGRFLSTIQIGITLVGVLTGAFSGATLGTRFAAWIAAQGVSPIVADAVGVGSVVIAITYLSLIVGELVPKQIALRDPESIAVRVAPAMAGLSRISAPLVWVLDASGDFVLRLLGQHGERSERVTEEEVKTVIAEAESAGVLERGEHAMISGVMRLADRSARALMTPRRDVELIDLTTDPATIRRQLRETQHSRLPVRDGGADSIVGVVVVKDLFDDLADGRPLDVRKRVREAPTVMDGADALDVLQTVRTSPAHMALVFDEYGHFEGVVTAGDILEAIVGTADHTGGEEPSLVQRDDGSWLVAGWMPIDEFIDRTRAPIEKTAEYETVAGFLLHRLGRLPQVGESFTLGNWRFEIVDLDGNRIDKVLVSRLDP